MALAAEKPAVVSTALGAAKVTVPGPAALAHATVTGAPATGDTFEVNRSRTESIFDTIRGVVDILRQPAGNPTSNAKLASTLQGSLQQMDQATDHFLGVRAMVVRSASLRRVVDGMCGHWNGAKYAAATAEARRRELVRIAAERELLVLEDNPYGMLRYEGDPLPTLYSLDGGEYVIYPIFEFKHQGHDKRTGKILGQLEPTGNLPTFLDEARARNQHIDEAWFRPQRH